jgi:hypothetical protein
MQSMFEIIYCFMLEVCQTGISSFRSQLIKTDGNIQKHLNDKASAVSSGTEKCPYHVHDALQFMAPQITKKKNQLFGKEFSSATH